MKEWALAALAACRVPGIVIGGLKEQLKEKEKNTREKMMNELNEFLNVSAQLSFGSFNFGGSVEEVEYVPP